jgi:small ligand-binding sensory domain FIST
VRWASVASELPRFDEALARAAGQLRERLGGNDAQLLFAFVSHHHRRDYEGVLALREVFPDALLVGCSAGAVIGGGREIEETPGVALCAARLPGVELVPLESAADPDAEAPLRWAEHARDAQGACSLVVLADPFSFPAEPFLHALDRALPGAAKIGGLASGGTQPGENALFLGGSVRRGGAVGVGLRGDVALETVVAQGCRPVGSPMFVTRCRGNVLLEVDGRSPVEVLNDLYARGDAREQALFRTSLFLGIEMDPDRTEYGRGDFLVRNLMGADPDSGTLAVAAPLRDAQVVQFHVRDARTAAEDLEERLARVGGGAGALLFSCLGRGRHLYGLADHDSSAFRRHLGDLPLAGFFCNGEIGPVGGSGRTFLHGYTSAFGIFRPASAGHA